MDERSSAESVQGVIEAFGAGGVEASLAYVHPEIEWHAPPEWLEQRLYVGHAGLRKLASFWTGQFDDYGFELERVIELEGGDALALLHQRGRIKASGDEVEQEIGYLVASRDGLLVRVNVYFSWADALEAAGLEA